MVVVMIVSVAPAPDQKGLQVYFHICNDCIQVIWENTKDERYSTMVSVVGWLPHHGGSVLVSLAPTPGRGHAHLLPTTSTMLAPRRARFLLKKLLGHWL